MSHEPSLVWSSRIPFLLWSLLFPLFIALKYEQLRSCPCAILHLSLLMHLFPMIFDFLCLFFPQLPALLQFAFQPLLLTFLNLVCCLDFRLTVPLHKTVCTLTLLKQSLLLSSQEFRINITVEGNHRLPLFPH